MSNQLHVRAIGYLLASWVVLLCCTLTGCATTVAGRGEADVVPSTADHTPDFPSAPPTPARTDPGSASTPLSPPSSFSPPSPPSPLILPTPTATGARLGPITATTNLADRLAPAPTGARLTGGGSGTLTVHEYVEYYYQPAYQDEADAELTAQGVLDIVHRTWSVRGGGTISIVLFRFDTAAGAQSRFLYDSASAADIPGEITFTVPGYPLSQVRGFLDAGLTDAGDATAQVVADLRSGNVAMEAFYLHPATIDKAELSTWITGQLARLR